MTACRHHGSVLFLDDCAVALSRGREIAALAASVAAIAVRFILRFLSRGAAVLPRAPGRFPMLAPPATVIVAKLSHTTALALSRGSNLLRYSGSIGALDPRVVSSGRQPLDGSGQLLGSNPVVQHVPL